MTSTNYTDAQRAEGMISIAIQRVADKYVFHCKVLEQFKVRERTAVSTMAVAVSGDHILLWYNATFVLSTPMPQLVGVLLHEVHHVLFGHMFASPADYPDHWARTVAEEVTANEFIKEPLPGNPILLQDFPCLGPMQSTDQRYARLKKEVVRSQITVPTGQPLSSGNAGGGTTLDDHTVWEEGQRDRDKAKATVESLIQDVVLEVGLNHVPKELKDTLRDLGIGTMPGGGQDDLLGGQHGRLDWRRLLRRYAGQILQVRTVFSRPSRRFPELVGIVPGKRRQGSRPRVMAVNRNRSEDRVMIRPVKFPVPRWHAQFLAMLPKIRNHAAVAFSGLNPEAREEAVQEVVANALRAYVRLVELKKEAIAYPTVLARYAVAQIRSGRQVGNKLNVRDVSSNYAQRQKGFHVERLDHYDDEENAWQEVVIESKAAGPAEVAATRIDFAAWLRRLPTRTRKITKLLATGEKTSIVAKRFRLSAGRISQLRNELAHSWKVFQQEPQPTNLFRRVAANPAA